MAAVGVLTAEQYRASLRDQREVYYRGERVADVTTHPIIGVAVDHGCIDYMMAHDPRYRALAVVRDPETGAEFSRYYQVPRGAGDLLQRGALIAAGTREGATLVVLIKEIGTDALFALMITADILARRGKPEYADRVRRYYELCRERDAALAVAQTDVKGDRSLGPAAQEHPDYYLRIVDQRADGIVVRGAKVHTSAAVNAHEVIVLPTRAMQANDKAYAVAFAVPIATKGLKLVASPYGGWKKDPFEFPVSARHKLMETMTIFDDVFVPWERVFLCGEWEAAGLLALTFVKFHRFTAVSYKLPLLEALVGAAAAVAEFNGISSAGHVREKLAKLAAYHTTVQGLVTLAAEQCRTEPPDIAVPNALLTNVAKWHFASNYHAAIQFVQDLSGGLLVTAPGVEDWRSETTGPYLQRYFGGKPGTPVEHRLRMIHLISDLTASDYAGWQEVLAVHAEGSLEAEKLQTFREYDFGKVAKYARKLAGIE